MISINVVSIKGIPVNADEKLRFTVKTRIGFEDAGRAEELLDITIVIRSGSSQSIPGHRGICTAKLRIWRHFPCFWKKARIRSSIWQHFLPRRFAGEDPRPCSGVRRCHDRARPHRRSKVARELRGVGTFKRRNFCSFHDAVYESLKKRLRTGHPDGQG